MSALDLAGVDLRHGRRLVLENIGFSIGDGEFIGVLGPNGAGKTTLMRAILGMLPVHKGTLRVFGEPARRGNPAIGYLPQARGLPGSLRLRGREFVAAVVSGHRLGLPVLTRDGAREVDWALDQVGARHLATRSLGDMSGGERQRIFIAQALIGRPRLLLLDEPLISLDPHYQSDVVALVKRLQVELGMAVLFSAHELNPLLGALDRVLHLGHHQAILGSVDAVITGPVLSRLYGMPIDVLKVNGRIFVMSGPHDIERDMHRHDV